MAKKRKDQAAVIRFGPAVRAFLLCMVIGGSGVGYVWQKSKIDELGRDIKKREVGLAQLREQNKKLRDQLATMLLPDRLEQRARDLNLGLVPSQPGQIWRLSEPPATPVAEPGRQFAAQPPQGP